VDNQLDSATGTLHLRAVVPNPRRVLTPGLFVRIRVPMGLPKPVLMVPEEALGTDQGRKFVYVVGDDNKAAYRPVKVGKLHDGLRVIAEGLKEGERVVVDGLQRVRPGAVVAPKASGQRPVASGQ
jgi:RND family efflux transporter MFP subunit